ncbi:MAG TPA: prepilin-type N-terminal cleavage/methylation domain-containing protein [Verrucomicrobiae bacterium]|nr:prepilin-type N-terminal cleavage/methylation domain-containing protein [Verrucomicrobiae bacterium]
MNSEFGIRNSEFPDPTPGTPRSALRTPRLNRAFTLIELLVVISIIGILAAIGLPAMRGMTRSNAMTAANRQFLDDLAYARQRAIGDHTTVYVVFVPPAVAFVANTPSPANQALYKQYTNLYTGQYTTYALLSLRQLGDQPGVSIPKYLTGWRSLPSGVFIATNKFGTLTFPPQPGSPFYAASGLPFPMATNYPPNLALPCLVFNYQGQLVYPFAPRFQDEYIPLARGSIFFDPTTLAADVQENPTGNSIGSASNVVYINSLTGRAKILQAQIQ